jgi:hypothetical protein
MWFDSGSYRLSLLAFAFSVAASIGSPFWMCARLDRLVAGGGQRVRDWWCRGVLCCRLYPTPRAHCLRGAPACPRRPPSASGPAPLRCSLRGCWRVRWGHARTGVQGWVTGNGFAGTALLGADVACGRLGDTRKVFDRMPVLDVVT